MDAHGLKMLCKENNIVMQKKIIAEISKKDFFSMTDEDWLMLFLNMGFDNMQTIRKTRASVIRLYEGCISKGYTDYNPFDSIKLDSKNIFAAAKKQVYITQAELEQGINQLKNKAIGECILRMFYEGVRDVEDLYYLTLDQVDLKKRTIDFEDYSIQMSEALYNAVRIYQDTWSMDNFELYRPFENSFVKVNLYRNTTDFLSNFTNTASRFVRGAGFKKVHLYGSGFIHFLYKKCGSIEKMDELFYADDKMRGYIMELCNEIEQYGKEYGLFLEGKYIRFRYKSYYESFKIKM